MIGTVALVLLGVIAALLAWSTYSRRTYFSKLGLRGPTPLPIFGNVLGFKIGVHTALEQWSKEYGKTFGIFRGAKAVIVSSDVEFAKEIMVKQFAKFTDRQGFPLRPELMGSDLLDLKGERWKAVRDKIALAFTKSKMQKMVPIVTECADQAIKNMEDDTKKKEGADGILNILDADPDRAASALYLSVDTFPLHSYMSEYGLDTAYRCFFASKLISREEKWRLLRHADWIWERFKKVYLPWLLTVLLPWTEPFLRKLGCSLHPRKSVEYFADSLWEIINTRKSDLNTTNCVDFLQIMLNSGEMTETSTGRVAQKCVVKETEIFSNCLLVFTGNHETCPSTLTFIFYMLAMHPDVQERVIAEVDQVNAEEITLETVQTMTYVDMVIREGLRMYPTVASLDRLCLEDCVVKGIKIPKGTIVEIAVTAVHNDPDYWTDPYKFDPERFSPANKGKFDSMAFLGFGQGPRMCVGYRFGLVELTVMMISVLRKFRVETCPETEIPPKRGTRGLLTSDDGIILRLVPRQDTVA